VTPEEFALALLDILAPQLAQALMERLFPGQNIDPFPELNRNLLAIGGQIRDAVTEIDGQVANVQSHLNGADSALQSARQDIIAAVDAAAINPNAPPWYSSTPPWYTAPSGDPFLIADIATVSAKTGDVSYNTRADSLAYQHQNTRDQLAFSGLLVPGNPYVALIGAEDDSGINTFGHWGLDLNTTPPPVPDLSLVEFGEGVLAFLQRTQPEQGWTDVAATSPNKGYNGQIWCPGTYHAPYTYWITLLKEADLHNAQASATITGETGGTVLATNTAPVWPGLAAATLGSPVSLASGVTITEPMDGVLVHITGTDPDFGHYYTYDDLRAYRNVGALVFISDDGQAEGFQPIGFTSAVYCPRSMKRAAAVKMKVGHGLTGTVTPWTITPT
jgi:hypothetical protein